MRKILIIALFILGFTRINAQNIQLLYDFGKDRKCWTSTVEMFRPDNAGYTFFFIDFDYGQGDVKGVSMSYIEIARSFSLGKSPFSWHAEFNGGLGQWKDGDAEGAYTINNAWLTGIEYSWNNAGFTKGFNLQALYKNIRQKHDLSFQLTCVWYINFANDRLSFTGFADFWREDMEFDGKVKKLVFQAEPQLWYNFSKNFAAGSEVDVSHNFVASGGITLLPTLGLKYTF